MTIGEKIAYVVKYFDSGNKTAFARKIGIKDGKPALVNDWIHGRAKPGYDYRVKICVAYADDGVTSEWLNDDNAMYPPLPTEIRRISIDEFGKMEENMGKKNEISPFYVRLEAECKKKGVSIAEMAAACGFGTSTAYKWKGDTVPYGKTLQTIASYLGTTSDYLLNGKTATALLPELPVQETAPVSASLSIDRLISLWEQDRAEAKVREDRLFGLLAERQGAEIKSLSDKVESLGKMLKRVEELDNEVLLLKNISQIPANADNSMAVADKLIMVEKK